MNCHEMKTGKIYECPKCGLKVQVVSECKCERESCDSCAPNELDCCGTRLKQAA